MKKTAGQAFQIKNSDETYVFCDGNGNFSNVATPALATIFEFINKNIVVYDTFTQAGNASILTPITNGNTITCNTNTNVLDILSDAGSGIVTFSKSWQIQFGKMGSLADIAPGWTGKELLLASNGGATAVPPPAGAVDPSKMFIYVASNSVRLPYVNTTAYEFVNNAACKPPGSTASSGSTSSDKKSSDKKKKQKTIAIVVGAAAGVILLAVGVWALYHFKLQNKNTS
jgi:hypothetical protein